MKRVLLIAFYFPPRNHVAGYRTGCFAKYLPEQGWMPTVICEDWPADRPGYDPDFVENIPAEVEVIRIPGPSHRNALQRMVLRKLLPYCRPDHAPYLWQKAGRTIAELSRRIRFDAIWATSDPIVTMALGYEASVALKVPWMADIRDSFNVQPFGSWYKRPIWAYHERRLCRKAQAIVAVSPHLAEVLGQAVGRPIQIIENGFDPELFSKTPPAQKNAFTLAYTGNMSLPLQNPRPVLQAVESLLRTGAVPRDKLEVVFYGPSASQINSAFLGAIGSLPVRVFPLVPHKQIVPVQQSSSALLLLTVAGQKGVLTGKLFDYLAAKRPVLAVPDDDGDVSSLLRQTGVGIMANTPEQIAGVLSGWYREWEKTGQVQMPRNEDAILYYSRRSQARRLAATLDHLISSPSKA